MENARKLDLAALIQRVAVLKDNHPENSLLKGDLLQGENGNDFSLEVENSLQLKLVAKRYFDALKEELEKTLGEPVNLVIKVSGKKTRRRKTQAEETSTVEDNVSHTPPVQPVKKGFLRGMIRSDYRLDNFVVGDCNRLAVEAIKDIVNKGNSRFYPLYLYSSCGLGKSHLLQGFCTELHERSQQLKICYIACDEFVNQFIESIKNNKQNEFRDKYRQLDVLVVDDVHFLSTKKASQEEFVHTFNAMQNASGTLVLSSDAPPSDQREIKQHLRERFGGGLVLELDLPDFDTRVEILLTKLRQKIPGKSYTPQWRRVIEYIATKSYTNVREYEGALNKVLFGLQNNDSSDSLALEKVRELLKENRTWTVADCFRIIQDKFSLSEAELKSRSRNRSLSLARSFLIRLLREKISLSLKEVGKILDRAHTSILELDNKTIKKINTDPEWLNIWESVSDSE